MENHGTLTFQGMLKNTKYPDNIDKTFLKLLIKNDIITKNANQYLTGENSQILDFPIEFNNVSYDLSIKFLDEIYNILEDHALYGIADPFREMETILFKLESYLNVNSKIEFLENTYTSEFPTDLMYSVYSDKLIDVTGVNGITSWREWIYLNLKTSPHIIRLYLTSNSSYFIKLLIDNEKFIEDDGLIPFFEMLNDWAIFYEKKILLDAILEKLEELKNPSSKNLNGTTKTKPQLTEPKPSIDYSKIKLVDLFRSKLAYIELEGVLVSNGYFDKDLKFQGVPVSSDKKLMCAMIYRLNQSDLLVEKSKNPEYFKGDRFITKALINAFNNTFKGVELTENNYSTHKSNNFENFTLKSSEKYIYEQPFNFISNIAKKHSL